MDRVDACFTSNAAADDSASLSSGGAIFSGSKHFTVAGGTFTNIANNYFQAPNLPLEFRIIPFGDIDLQREISVNNDSNIVDRQRSRREARKVYSAKIDGRKSRVAVAIYQGDSAEEDWQRDIAKYRAVRHPNIVQVYGTAYLDNMHATIFHDDLIPLQHFFDLHQDSHFATIYLHAYVAMEFTAVEDYFSSAFQYTPDQEDFTLFIRSSTGRLCADLVPSHMYCFYPNSGSPQTFSESGLAPFAKLNMESTIISSLTLDQYHCPCYWKLAQDRSTSVSTSEPVNLGAVYSGSSDSNWADIACMPYLKLERDTYFSYMDDRRPKEVMENGWTQLASGDAAGAHSDFKWVHHLQHFHEFSGHWFSQANHVFKCLGISSNFENYILTHRIEFHLSISRTTAEPPEGFLFFCPPDDFRIDGPSSFKWPDCPAYWSFDPSGVERLSREDAVSLGFPSMNFSTQLYGLSWDEKVYPGLWQCHQAKGFDPDTQDLARHLGYPLYQVSSETRPTFAHIDGEQPCEGHGQSDNIPEPVDTHHAASLDTASQHSSLAEELSVSNTFRFVRNFVADLIPGAHAESEEGIGFSPILM